MTIPPHKDDGPVVIHLSDEERDTGDLTPIHLFEAIDAFYVDGVVVLENAIEVKYIEGTASSFFFFILFNGTEQIYSSERAYASGH